MPAVFTLGAIVVLAVIFAMWGWPTFLVMAGFALMWIAWASM